MVCASLFLSNKRKTCATLILCFLIMINLSYLGSYIHKKPSDLLVSNHPFKALNTTGLQQHHEVFNYKLQWKPNKICWLFSYLGRTHIRNLATFWWVITHLRPLIQLDCNNAMKFSATNCSENLTRYVDSLSFKLSYYGLYCLIWHGMKERCHVKKQIYKVASPLYPLIFPIVNNLLKFKYPTLFVIAPKTAIIPL